jgi:hypothetical protein
MSVFIENSLTLKKFKLNFNFNLNRISPDCLKNLFHAIQNNKSIEVFDLSNNSLVRLDENITNLSTALIKNTTILELNLAGNDIRDNILNMENLCKALLENKS